MKTYKSFFLVLAFVSLSVYAFAEGQLIKDVIEAGGKSAPKIMAGAVGRTGYEAFAPISPKSLRAGVVTHYMSSNQALQDEWAKGVGNSEIGTYSYLKYHKWRDRTQFLKNDVLREKISAWVRRSDKKYTDFPMYYRDFPQMWNGLPMSKRSLTVYESVLDGAYGERSLFGGQFITELNDVFALFSQPVQNPVYADKALENALAQAFEKKNGFLVITVAGNERRPKDVLILDLAETKFISLRYSQKALWAQQSRNERIPFEVSDSKIVNFQGVEAKVFDHRSTSGVIMGTTYIAPKATKKLPLPNRIIKEGMSPADALDSNYTIMISNDGKQWAVFARNSKEGTQIFNAFHAGLYIYFSAKDLPPNATSPWEEIDGNVYWEPHDYTLSFASQKGAPLFSRVEDARAYRHEKKLAKRAAASETSFE